MSGVTASTGPGSSRSDAALAVRNAVTLGGSLLLTWGIALGVRLMMPRYLGPDAFGVVNFADALTATAFVLIGLGLDTYIRKEVSVDPARANAFFAGATAVRVVGAVLLSLGIQAFLVLTDRPRETWLLVHLYGVAAFFTTMNFSLGALLHARGTVNGLSVLNIVSKVVWGTGTMLTVVLGWPLWGLPAALVISEVLKLVVSLALVQRHLALSWRIDVRGLKAALWASLPIFINVAAHTIYSKLDVSIVAVVAGDREVAWYGSANLLAGLALMVTPVIGWVLLPLFARARARSDEEYTLVMRRSLELVLVVAVPTTLFMALGAREWLTWLYGAAYAPAAPALRILSSIFVLTYVAILSSNALILTGRAWAQAVISLSGLVLNPLMNAFLIKRCAEVYGDGGAGIGAAISQLATEVLVTVMMTALVGRRAFDRRSLSILARSFVVCVLVVGLDRWLDPQVPGAVRLLADAGAYAVLAVGLGAVRVRETLAFARGAFKNRHGDADAATVQTTQGSTT